MKATDRIAFWTGIHLSLLLLPATVFTFWIVRQPANHPLRPNAPWISAGLILLGIWLTFRVVRLAANRTQRLLNQP